MGGTAARMVVQSKNLKYLISVCGMLVCAPSSPGEDFEMQQEIGRDPGQYTSERIGPEQITSRSNWRFGKTRRREALVSSRTADGEVVEGREA